MSHMISVDWEDHQLSGLDADASADGVRVRRLFQVEWPEDIKPAADARRAGEWLRSRLEERGISGRRALVSLPRADAVVRQLEIPDVPDDELPDIVRLQAEMKASATLDQVLLDFLPLPRSSNATMRQVLMVTVPRSRIETVQHVFEAAGLELLSVGLSPVATAEVVSAVEQRRNISTDDTSLIVARHSKRVEISLVRNRHLLLTHSTLLEGHEEQRDNQAVLAEIRRSLGALARIESNVSIGRAWVIGMDEAASFLQLIANDFHCEVAVLDPLVDAPFHAPPGDSKIVHAPFAGPVGMLLGIAGATVDAIDFLNPRKPVVRIDRRRLQFGIAVGVAVAAMIVGLGATRWKVWQLNRQLEENRDQLTRLEEAVKNGRPTVLAANAIDEWAQRDINWLEQTKAINEMLPGTSQIYLADLRISPSTGERLGLVQATGFAKSRESVETFYQRLAENGYRVQPQEIRDSSSDSRYPFTFRLEVAVTMETKRINLRPTANSKSSNAWRAGGVNPLVNQSAYTGRSPT